MIRKVGLTGNIGSGKSLVARIFETLRIPVFYADVEGKKMLDTEAVQNTVTEIFGAGIIKNQKIDRAALAEIVFSDQNKLEQLNQIIHPAVRKHFSAWAQKQNTPYVIYEAAILHESGHYQNMDKIVLVKADETLRIRRVMQRDNIGEEQIRSRMKNQWPEFKKEKLSDFVIENNENQLLIPQVIKIHKKLTGV